jgi:uncharacterized protein YndB with AHSA1/START domain
VLDAAGLANTARRGREKLHYLNPGPIAEISERWIRQYDRGRVDALADLKGALEEIPMGKPSFLYSTYIRTTPERLWQAPTAPAFTERYWDLSFETDWQAGSAPHPAPVGPDDRRPRASRARIGPVPPPVLNVAQFTPEWRRIAPGTVGTLEPQDAARDRRHASGAGTDRRMPRRLREHRRDRLTGKRLELAVTAVRSCAAVGSVALPI